MNGLRFYLIVIVLAVLGSSLFWYKASRLDFPLSPDSTEMVWHVEASVSFLAKNRPARISLLIPRSDRSTLVLDEQFVSRGFGFSSAERGFNRQAIWSLRKARGRHTIFYRAVVRKFEHEDAPTSLPPAKVKPPKLDEPSLIAIEALVTEIRASSADIDSFTRALLRRLDRSESLENENLLLGPSPTTLKKLEVASQVLNYAGIGARLAHGIRLIDQIRHAPIEHWLEVYDKDHWESYWRGRGSQLPPEADYLVWWRGGSSLFDISGAKKLSVELSVARSQEEAIDSAIVRTFAANRAFFDFSLLALPLRTQAVYRVLMLIPIGALLVVIARNLIGIKTFGTFMPVLIALAFRETDLLNGVFYFSLILAMGLGIRVFLERLRLLVVPRLAVVLSAVVLLLVGISTVTQRMGLEYGLSVALFPIVIIAMTIERMSVVWEERGSGEALIQALGTLLVAVVTYAVITNEIIQHLVFVFPELLLLLIAVLLLLGRYPGYRLLELWRFRALVKAQK